VFFLSGTLGAGLLNFSYGSFAQLLAFAQTHDPSFYVKLVSAGPFALQSRGYGNRQQPQELRGRPHTIRQTAKAGKGSQE